MKKFISVLLMLLFFAPFCASAAQMSARVRTVPQDITQNVFTNPADYLPKLVTYLTASSHSTAEKVKVLHDWICDNIAYDTSIFDGGRGVYDVKEVLLQKRAVCSGYANLMCAMCQIASVECIAIDGYSKGYAFSGEVSEEVDHAWNAVRYGNRWQLLDVTYDAGFCDGKYFVKHYSEDYFRLTPIQFIKTHFPSEEKYQYLSDPLTKDDFISAPYFNGTFFTQGLSVLDSQKNETALSIYDNKVGEATTFSVGCNKATIRVMATLRDRAGVKDASRNVWYSRAAGILDIIVDPPDKNTYIASIHSCLAGAVSPPVFITATKFEGLFLPQLDALLISKKISEAEKTLFIEAYTKCDENSRYYYNEDLFYTAKVNAVIKVCKLLKESTEPFEEVANFFVTPSDVYNGSISSTRFPAPYVAYSSCVNTKLISPLKGVLKAASEETFSVTTKDFSSVALLISDKLTLFKKDQKTGVFSITVTVPDDSDILNVFASKNARNFEGLFSYTVEK